MPLNFAQLVLRKKLMKFTDRDGVCRKNQLKLDRKTYFKNCKRPVRMEFYVLVKQTRKVRRNIRSSLRCEKVIKLQQKLLSNCARFWFEVCFAAFSTVSFWRRLLEIAFVLTRFNIVYCDNFFIFFKCWFLRLL